MGLYEGEWGGWRGAQCHVAGSTAECTCHGFLQNMCRNVCLAVIVLGATSVAFVVEAV